MGYYCTRRGVWETIKLDRLWTFQPRSAFCLLAAALAPVQSHVPPTFEAPSKLPATYDTADLKLSPNLSRRYPFSLSQVVSFAFLVVVLLAQFLLPPNVHFVPSFRGGSYHGDSVDSTAVCQNTPIFFEPLPTSALHRMSLIEEAEKVAAEFEYSPKDVNKGVKEFIQQMG